jgi:hypothetical protein
MVFIRLPPDPPDESPAVSPILAIRQHSGDRRGSVTSAFTLASTFADTECQSIRTSDYGSGSSGPPSPVQNRQPTPNDRAHGPRPSYQQTDAVRKASNKLARTFIVPYASFTIFFFLTFPLRNRCRSGRLPPSDRCTPVSPR